MDNLQLGKESDLPIPPDIASSGADSHLSAGNLAADQIFHCATIESITSISFRAVVSCRHIPSGVSFSLSVDLSLSSTACGEYPRWSSEGPFSSVKIFISSSSSFRK
ncbi:hypothetical protein CEXT_8681 [Caerostris extrusa]|uniref:Uncharacterized protein n=1 Tax=Caerostris extrusa TaxID=172846 RepID=A0AAV4UT88_CAEEX|nr:hypothetical protein CEXT_8681 [Caerostris extrusa]